MTKEELQLLFEAWIKKQILSASSKESYVRDIKIFFREYLSGESEPFIDKHTSESFINAKEISFSTRKRRFVSLRRLYAFSQEESLFFMEREFSLFPSADQRRASEAELLSGKEIRHLFELKVEFSFSAYRDKAIFETIYLTGMRLNELTEIRCRDVNISLGYLSFRRGDSMVTIPVHQECNKALIDYISHFRNNEEGSEEYLFVNRSKGKLSRQTVWKIVVSFARRCYPEKLITPYSLRKSFAIQMAENGASYEHISKVFGIKDISFLLEYNDQNINNYSDFYKYHPQNRKN